MFDSISMQACKDLTLVSLHLNIEILLPHRQRTALLVGANPSDSPVRNQISSKLLTLTLLNASSTRLGMDQSVYRESHNTKVTSQLWELTPHPTVLDLMTVKQSGSQHERYTTIKTPRSKFGRHSKTVCVWTRPNKPRSQAHGNRSTLYFRIKLLSQNSIFSPHRCGQWITIKGAIKLSGGYVECRCDRGPLHCKQARRTPWIMETQPGLCGSAGGGRGRWEGGGG